LPTKGKRGPWLWPIALAAVGVVLLLNNFLLLGEFNAASLLPLILVVIGAAILLRGDLIPSSESRTFGITRGSVEAAILEISSGEIDVQIRALQQEGRLIAGQYALGSRPSMFVSETQTHLKMERAATPWLSFADWEMGLAHDLPWQVFISTNLGQANLNLAGLIMQESVIATGFGDIRLVCPQEALGTLQLQSALGNIHIVTPPGYRTQITIQGSSLFHIHADERRYAQPEPYVFTSLEPEANAPLVEVVARGTFGDAYLT
jgi:hypothetical protein